MQFRHFFERGRRFWKGADCPTLRAKMASLPVIAALEWAYPLSALCAECTLSAVRSSEERLRKLCDYHQLRARSPEPAVIIDAHDFA
jgi:hypothetical protein